MKEAQTFGLLVLVVAGAGLLAVLSNRFGGRIKVPLPVVFLVAAAAARLLISSVHAPSDRLVERVVTLALLLVLFDGGQQIGWSRFRQAAAPIAVVGVLGTFLTVAAAALLIHVVLGLSWYLALLVATAVSPTDPAVVFSVLGQREIAGRSSTILEGESGANDPVGIALMVSLIATGGVSVHALGHVGTSFLLQIGVGAAVGILGGLALGWHMRHVSLPSEGLYPLRTLAGVLVLFGIASVAHGSGFLAVFVAGIALGDTEAPYKREIDRFHAALGSLGEIVAFSVLGLMIDLGALIHSNVWIPGLIIGTALAVAIRPVMVGLCLLPARLRRNEQTFVLLSGLKGAVPILLATYILAAHPAHAQRLFGIVVVVVLFSVVVQGSLVPVLAERLRLPMRILETEPWALGVRLRDEPRNARNLTIATGSAADGQSIDELEELTDQARISLLVRESNLVPITSETRLRAGDTILVLAEHESDLDRLVRSTGEPRSQDFAG